MKKVHANEAIPLEKFNPYHDEKGRFSGSEGAHSVTITNQKAVVTMKDKDAKNLIWNGEKHNPKGKESKPENYVVNTQHTVSILGLKGMEDKQVNSVHTFSHNEDGKLMHLEESPQKMKSKIAEVSGYNEDKGRITYEGLTRTSPFPKEEWEKVKSWHDS